MEIIGKICRICNQFKSFDEFRKRDTMKDGHRSECKSCLSERSAKKYAINSSDPDWLEKDRTRNRELQRTYSPSLKPVQNYRQSTRFSDRFPEKLKANSMSQGMKKPFDDAEKHHWSYNDEHWRDVIWLSMRDHRFIHRFLVYDQKQKLYCTVNGSILNSRGSHEKYISGILNNKQIFNGTKRKDNPGTRGRGVL